ncbi:MAG: CotH kinase family protein, partial [Dyadobacter sp.]|uniref:CotH kinase family protein n=1 Tax=Dyadobacter sp. TaxID=1914288 RepID=UPI003264099B
MKTFTSCLVVLALVLSSFCVKAQISLDNYRFYIDEPRKLIVSDQLPTPAQITVFPIQVKLGDQTFTFANGITTLSVGVKYTITNSGKSYSLYFTELPVINLQIADPSQINGTDEIPGAISLSDGKGTPYNSNMAIRTRGNSSSFFPKKSYRVQLKDGAGKNKDESLLGLRNDKRWLFLALWNEEIRANNMISHNLWIDIHKVYYAASEPKAISSIRLKYVEVFMNKSYLGVYGFAEDMDRKQLALKKEDGGVTHGELYKADDWSLSAAFAGIGVAKAEPGSADWQHWELEYPDYSDWQNHYNFLKAVIESSDNDFKNNIGNLLKIDNLIDYFIFTNLLLVEDNMEKNYFLARYDQGEPYFIIPWDLDATWSYFPDGKRSNRVEGERTTELYKRLFKLNPNDFKNKLATRWFALRQNLLTESNLKGRFSTSYNTLNSNLIYERESLVAQDQYGGGNRSGGLNYIHSFISQRLVWLDNYFCPMVVGGNCNNPVTCNFAIAPTANSQSYTPQQAMTFNANCTGADCGSVTYAWTGNGANASGASANINAPSAPGDYTYTLTASKAGCADKTASLTIHVGNAPVECDFNVTAAPSNATPACS